MKNETSHTHILPLRLYLSVGGALIVLTALTVAISFVHFGPFNLVIAMLIAAGKATLVALFFMHLKYDNKLYMTIFVASVVFLAVFIILTMFDTLRRDDIDAIKSRPIQERAVIYDSLKTMDSPVTDDSTAILVDTIATESPER